MAGVNMRFMGVLVACLALLIQTSIAATAHTVGDSTGWTIPSSSSFYSTWASKQTFSVGDSLVFPFTTGHTVAEVSKAEYGTCTASNPISISSSGPTTIKLTTAGTHYFICTVSGHCNAGQKLAVTAASSTTSTSASPSPSPTTSSPSPTTASAPTPSSFSGTALTPSDVASSPTTSTTVPTSPSPAGGSTAPGPTSSATVAGAGMVMPFVMIAAALLV